VTLKTAILSLTSALVENCDRRLLRARTELPVLYKIIGYFGERRHEKAADSHTYDRVFGELSVKKGNSRHQTSTLRRTTYTAATDERKT